MNTNYEQTSLLDEYATRAQRPVECLGLTFDNDEARQAYFLEILREKLKDPQFRKIEGFPIGDDEDILALSDPPYYTACPNPFIEDFTKYYGQPHDPDIPYSREPFAADVSEGKNDPIYNAHSYHTKVPHKAIMRYILHYTDPGDIVFDGFCGTGMAGVAAQMCGDGRIIESLGYKVSPDGTILNYGDLPFSKLGSRHVILNDLSPAATFIAYNYNMPTSVEEFQQTAKRVLEEAEAECGWMYLTLHHPQPTQIEKAILLLNSENSTFKSQHPELPWGRINYVIWSDVFICRECTAEIVFWDVAVNQQEGTIQEKFKCPRCQVILTKRGIEHAFVNKFDKAINQAVRQAKQVPVLINYNIGNKRFEKKPDAFDFELLEKIDTIEIPNLFPINRMLEGDEARRNDDIGITHVHHFYTKRNLHVLGSCFNQSSNPHIKWSITGIMQRASKQHQIAITRIGGEKANQGGATAGHRRGTLYVPSNQVEFHPFELLTERWKIISKSLRASSSMKRDFLISTCSTDSIDIGPETVDYIFIDPPFGGNIMYSELNFLWEAWLKVFTNIKPEAIENRFQKKRLLEYQELMARSFQRLYRLLKSGHWMTLEFHNRKNSVWNAIQEALQSAGFVIADVSTLDKKLLTHTQRTAAGSVNQDLVISCYKPNRGLEERFKLEAGTADGAWDFTRMHLKQLPVFISNGGQAEVIAERMDYLLFDRMVAFHVQRGVTVPLSSPEFYAGLAQRFPQRDEMYFLPDQVAEYDKKRITVKEVLQLQLLITDEASAIQWLRQILGKKPQTFQEIHPHFIKELAGWQKHEKQLELSELLEENFLRYEGVGGVPSQIHSYLSTNFKELRNLDKDNRELRSKAKDRWYVPDPNKSVDLEKLREKSLLKTFEEYQNFQGKQLKVFRLEAVRAGFKKAWQEHDYQTILDVAHNIPEKVLQEDTKLLMWYDQAKMRMGDES